MKKEILKKIGNVKPKIILLMVLIFVFALLYMIFDDTNFGGINNIQEMIKEEVLKDKIKKEIKERFNMKSEYNYNNYEGGNVVKGTKKEEKVIDDTTKKVKEDVEEKELDVEKVKPSMMQKFFDRLYFSVTTGTTLGYGDIYPLSNSVKVLSMLQTLSTIILILM
tara:strand:+ start:422 stop:916 length:495 start_codon:yes stop_codon:yes gene_type:complete